MYPTPSKMITYQAINSRTRLTPITQREKEVLNLIAHEHSSKEIAEKLFVSQETINSHRKNMMDKLGVRNAAGLVRVAFERGLMRVGQVAMIVMFFYVGLHQVDAQVENGNVNFLVVPETFTARTSGQENGDEDMVFRFMMQKDVDGTEVPLSYGSTSVTKNCDSWEANCESAYCTRGVSNPQSLYEQNSESSKFDWTIDSWEDDDTHSCAHDYNSNADHDRGDYTGIMDVKNQREGNTFHDHYLARQKTSSLHTYREVKLNIMWRYAKGNSGSSGQPLDFGIITNDDSPKSHINTNRPTPNGNVNLGYQSLYTGTNAQSSPDVFYQFEITGEAKRVTISTDHDETDFNTYLHLLQGNTHITSDDDGASGFLSTKSQIVQDLCPGIYKIVVEGGSSFFGKKTGDFKLSVMSQTMAKTQINQGTIAAADNSQVCEDGDLPETVNTRLPTTSAWGSETAVYRWERRSEDVENNEWITVDNETGSSLMPTGKMGTKSVYFRRYAIFCGVESLPTAPVIIVHQSSSVIPGTLAIQSGDNYTREGKASNAILQVTGASGNFGELSYEYFKGSESLGEIASNTYNLNQEILNTDTNFKVIVRNGCRKDSVTNTINIKTIPANGVITGKVSTKPGGAGAGVAGVTVTATPQEGLNHSEVLQDVTDASGNYAIEGLYYGPDNWNFNVNPILEGHNIIYDNPGNFADSIIPVGVNLTMFNFNQEHNFIDRTGFSIAGNITQAFESGDKAKMDIVVKLYERSLNGILYTGISDTTDHNGKYALLAKSGGLYVIIPEYLDVIDENTTIKHVFNPSSRDVEVTQDVVGIDFKDESKFRFKGTIADGCGKGIGKIKFSIKDEETINGSANGINNFYIEHNTFQDTFDFLLPARNYTIDIVEVTEADEAFAIGNDDRLAHMNQEIGKISNFTADLSFQDTVVHFRYNPTPIIEFEGLPEKIASCAEKAQADYHWIEQYKVYPDFKVKVWERQEACLLDTGYVKINSNGTGAPSKFPISEGIMKDLNVDRDFLLIGSRPNIVGDHKVPVAFTVFDNNDVNQGTKAIDFLVTGSIPLGQSFVSVSPSIPIIVLHDPPSDQGYVSYASGSRIRGTFRTGWKTQNGTTEFLDAKIGNRFTVGVAIASENEAYFQASGQLNTIRTDTETSERIFTFETTQEYQTSKTLTGDDADLFVGAAIDQTFQEMQTLKVDVENCEFTLDNEYSWSPDSINTTFVYNTIDIRNLIYQLDTARISNDNRADGDPNKKPDLFFTGAITAWQNVLKQNKKNKKDAIEGDLRYNIPNISIGGSNYFRQSITMDTGRTTTIETLVDVGGKVGVEQKVEIAGNGATGGVYFNTNTQFIPLEADPEDNATADTLKKRHVTMHIEDNDVGDIFSIGIYKDPVYATPVFKSNGSKSSCPYDLWDPENPDQKRLTFELNQISPSGFAVSNGNPAGEVFTFTITNTSSVEGNVNYVVYEDIQFNVNSATIKKNGSFSDAITIQNLPQGQTSRPIEITIIPSPTASRNNNTIKITVAPYCSGIDHTLSNESKSMDLCVSFPGSCSNIDLVRPSNGQVINSLSNNVVPLLMNNYDSANVSAVTFQYRKSAPNAVTGFNWINDKVILQADLPDDPSGYQTTWNTLGIIEDGTYDVRLDLGCEGSSVRNGSDIITVVIDRTKPMVFGTPSPVDDDYDQTENDEISVSFTEPICANGVTGASATLIDLYTNEVLTSQISCFDNTVKILDVDALISRPPSFYRVILNGIEDLHGNPANEFKWVFSVGHPDPTLLACVDDLEVSNNNSNQNAINVSSYSAVTIESDGSIPNFGETQYTAEEAINLNAGFEVKTGGELLAQIGDCVADNPCATVLSSTSIAHAPMDDVSWVIHEAFGCVESMTYDQNRTDANADIWIYVGQAINDTIIVELKSRQSLSDSNQSNTLNIAIVKGMSEYGIGNFTTADGNTSKMTAVFSYGMDANKPDEVRIEIRMDPLEDSFDAK